MKTVTGTDFGISLPVIATLATPECAREAPKVVDCWRISSIWSCGRRWLSLQNLQIALQRSEKPHEINKTRGGTGVASDCRSLPPCHPCACVSVFE